MKKIVCGALILAGILFLLFNEGNYDPEKELLKHLEKRYKKEFIVLSSTSMPSREGNLEYDAEIIPVEYLGTYKSVDDYYIAKGFIRVKKVKDRYINVLLGESAYKFYTPKLKELFGKNIFTVFEIEGDCEKDNIQEELARRKKIYEKEEKDFPREVHPYMNPNFDPLRINLYIFGNKEDIKNKEFYRDKIYKFIEYLKETEAFYYTTLSVKIIDEEIFTKDKFEEIKKQEEEERKKREKERVEYIERMSKWSFLNPYVDVEITKEDSSTKDEEEKENKDEADENSIKDMKDLMDRGLIAPPETLLNKYGKVLLSTYIISPERADNYVGERTYIASYERKEDICFDGEEQNYPNGTIKELGEDWTYYITETKNNKKNGTSIQYDIDGKVIWIGEYKNNKLDGSFKKYGEKYIEEGIYKNNLLEGEVKSTRTDGIVIKRMYKNGLQEGKTIYYNPDGSISGISEYKKGKLNGTSKEFGEGGKLYKITEWKNGDKNGKHIKYDSKGRVKLLVEFKNGMVDGVYKEFYEGQLIIEKNYKDNDENGLAKIYYPNGKIKDEILYKEGYELWHKSYSEEGKLKVYNIYDEEYANLKLRKVYNEDEKLIKEVEYTRDKRETVKEYREDGSLISTRYFKDGVEQKNQD